MPVYTDSNGIKRFISKKEYEHVMNILKKPEPLTKDRLEKIVFDLYMTAYYDGNVTLDDFDRIMTEDEIAQILA